MSRRFACLFVIAILLMSVTRVWGYDPASVYPENGFLFARAVIKDLMPQGDSWSKDMPEFSRVFDKTTAAVTAKLGFQPLRDVHEIGLFITADIEFQKRRPNHLVFFARGTFRPEQLMKVLPDMLEQLGPKAQQFAIKDQKGRQVITAPDFMAFFVDNETFLAGTPDVMEEILAGKAVLGKAPESLKPTLTSARFFLSADAKTLKEKSPKVKRDIERVPPPLRVHLEGLLNLVIAYVDGVLNLKADFSHAESSAFVASSLDAMRNQGLLECDSRLKKLEESLDQSSAAELLGEKRSQMLALAAGKDLLTKLQARASGNSFEASFMVPEPLRSMGANPALVPMVGVISAIAIPNFRKARDRAQNAACSANQCILQAAVEMYNMDNEQPMTKLNDSDAQEGGIFLQKGYLREPLVKPTPECSYYSDGDPSKDGRIRCHKHGSSY